MKEAIVITLESTAFQHKAAIPRKYSSEAEDISPPLSWSGAPEGTQEFVLICDDPDAPQPEPWVHWIVYGIPADTMQLPEGDGSEFTEGMNSWETTGYGGPMPPEGHGTHHYYFKIYALDTKLELEPGAAKEQVLQAMEGHIVAQGQLIGTYQR
jgi:Raf kinase inhibitor-like YbhB/YbcL family protein